MFVFVEVSKNTYPYRTLHVAGCPVLTRAKHQSTLGIDQVRRLDSVRMDYCSRCMKDTIGSDGQKVYSSARQEFWAIQRAFKQDEAETWRRIHLARRVVALRLALEEAEKEINPTDQILAGFLETTEREARADEYSPLEVTVSRR